jgi:hypothetical protein
LRNPGSISLDRLGSNIFSAHGLAFTRHGVTEKKATPDFIFPGFRFHAEQQKGLLSLAGFITHVDEMA